MRHLKDFEFIEGVVRAGSIRKASEDMNITASALNRRINKFEEEFGYEIFERLPRGVRLNPAGEMLMQHIRTQSSDFARLKSQVADLSGVRRGHVSIACSQALLPYFLPREIARYRSEHPGVTFSVNARDRVAADDVADLALRARGLVAAAAGAPPARGRHAHAQRPRCEHRSRQRRGDPIGALAGQA